MLAMARPFAHPTSKIFWIRKRVPNHLRVLIGKTEIKVSLDTRDPVEAKVRALHKLLEIEEQWASLLKGQQSVSEREAHDLADEVFQQFISLHEDNPSEQTEWDPEIGDSLWDTLPASPSKDWNSKDLWTSILGADYVRRTQMLQFCEGVAHTLLAAKGLILDPIGRDRIRKATGAALQRASLELQGRSSGPSRASTSIQSGSSKIIASKSSVSLQDLYDGWAKETGANAKTRYNYQRVMRALGAHLGHERANDVSRSDMLLWKTALLDAGISAKTIKDGKLAPVRAIFGWGVDNARVGNNPCTNVTIDVPKNAATRKRGYTDKEASLILQAALAEKDLARRWIPWLCATSGARLAEISQLRKSDVFQQDGIWCFRITAEAGSVKTISSELQIPI